MPFRRGARNPSRRNRIPAAAAAASSMPIQPSQLEAPPICPVSQAQIMFRCKQNEEQYDVDQKCSLCDTTYAEHPMSVATDPQEMLKAVFNPEARENKAPSDYQLRMLEVSVDKAVRELSEHSQIKGSFNPLSQLTKVFLQEYESRMSILAGQQHIVWIRVLPAVLHKSISAEFSWVNNNISLIPDLSWNDAKQLFSEHWRKTNSHLLLKTLYNDLKQGPHQSVNEFTNEFRKQMQLNDLPEDQRISDDFLMKLRPEITKQVLLQLRLREQAGQIVAPFTLDQLEETARLLDSTSDSLDDVQSDNSLPFNNRDFPRNNAKKRYRDSNSKGSSANTPASKPSKDLHCDNSTTHSTDECRLKRPKTVSETAPKNLKQEPGRSTGSTIPQSNHNKPRLTPQDDTWICIKCKKKAPGHYPKDCPQK
jgi:hypothetical protein